MKTRGMKMRRPHLQLVYVLAPEEELLGPYEMLWKLKHTHLSDPNMVKDVFFAMTEALVEHYSPKFDEGLEWDNRRELLK